MKSSKSVVVKQLPEMVTMNNVQQLRVEVRPSLDRDRPSLVFDCSNVRQIDSAGIDLLLSSLEEAMKRNGDVKLAAVSPQVSVILKLTRVDRLFEIFEHSGEAEESFSRFPILASGSRPCSQVSG